MKRKIYLLIIVSVLILATSIFIKPAIVFLSKKQLRKVFIDSKVDITGCTFKPLHMLVLSDIEIEKEEIYHFKVKEIKIQYNLLSIIRGNISEVFLKDVWVVVNLPQKSILELSKSLNRKSKGIFLVNSLELSNLNLNLKSKELNLKADISLELSLRNQLISYLDLKVDSLKSRGFQLTNASLKVAQRVTPGLLYINQIKYNKLRIERIKSSAKLLNKFLFLNSLSGELLGGKIQGQVSLKLEKNGEYSTNLKFISLDLDVLVNDFEMSQSAQITGRLDGTVNLEGNGFNIKALTGDFATTETGGILTVKDNAFLENIARSSNQSLDIIVESFKDYRYTTGVMKLSLNKGNLVLDISLDGETGKRNLSITVHDFKLRKFK